MKKPIFFFLLSAVCLLISTQTQAQEPANRTGYDYHIYVDNSVNGIHPVDLPTTINTTPAKSGGTGTESDPYIIASPEDMYELAIRLNEGSESSSSIFPNGNPGYSDQYFLMNSDIDLSSYNPWPCIGIPGEKIFYGNFDGGGNTISGIILDANLNSNQGLFAVIGNYAIVHGITLRDCQLNGTYYTGGIVGAAGEFTTIYDCHNFCDVSSPAYYSGGIAGASWGTIYNCTNAGNHNGNEFCGGIVGDFYGTIYNCVNTGNMTGSGSLGGIVGYSDGVSAKNLISSGKIVGSGGYNGGIIGFYASSITDKFVSDCVSFADVDCAGANSGAIIGRRWTVEGQASIIENCYYDKQLTLKPGVYAGAGNPDPSEGKFTHEMIGDGLASSLNNDFIFTEGLYPCPTGTEKSEIADVAIAPALFKFTNDMIFDMYNDINDHFTVALNNEVEWSSSNENLMTVIDHNVALLDIGTVTLNCIKGQAKKSIELTINTAPPYIGINNNNNIKINIYPNPATSHITIDGENIQTITVLDNVGRIINKYNSNGNKINIINTENLKSSLYFIKIEMQDGKTIVEKFVKTI
ncbi:T9SS type A sorting domain-containing protein [Odoribacter sp. OttesenSCG-928-L07]|nr:T9SS type A sorting domain-containing protein [Odoribacter sp. OttesenSCG-928-L07]MDL2240854.1 T9SS type A sorting domain-containing protein [Bacteroidales bacterium OttesenSCG-928-K22]